MDTSITKSEKKKPFSLIYCKVPGQKRQGFTSLSVRCKHFFGKMDDAVGLKLSQTSDKQAQETKFYFIHSNSHQVTVIKKLCDVTQFSSCLKQTGEPQYYF